MFHPNILIYRYIHAIFVIHLNNSVGGWDVHINHVCPFDLQTVWKKDGIKNLLLQAFIKGLIMMMKMTMTMMLLVEIRDDVEDDDLLGRRV